MKIAFWSLLLVTVFLFTSPAFGQSVANTQVNEMTDQETTTSVDLNQPGESAVINEVDEPGYPLLDADQLELFLDGMVKTAMEDQHLPGVTVSVVQNGKLLLAKGYGLARTTPPQPVVADQTLFRIGSISKTFTFTGVMQLVEQGRLNLDADIEPLLGDVELDDSYGPISMIDLMTHSAGFEDAYIGFFYADNLEADLEPADFLNRFQPHRVRPSGDQIVYSNYGVALAGRVLESVSGEDFNDYMDTHIFKPLGMTSTSFRDFPNQVADGYLDPELEKRRAKAYRWAAGKYVPYDHFFMPRGQGPAGSVSATATDMAIFMLAHLNGGVIDGQRILKTGTTEQMHTRLRTNAEGIHSNAHGLWNGQIRDYRTIEHGGAVLGFFSDMVLVPELGLGVFVSTNGEEGSGFVSSLTRWVLEQFFPVPVSNLKPEPSFSDRRDVYAGKYLSNRRGYEIIDKLASLGTEVTVSVSDDGYLITTAESGSKRWLPLGDQLFENADDGSRIAFEVDQSGVANRLYTAYGATGLDRISSLHSSRFFYNVSAWVLLLALGSLFGFWLRRKQPLVQTGGERLAAMGLGLTSLLWLLFFATFIILFNGAYAVEPEILVRYPTPLAWLVHLLAIVAAILAVAGIFGLLPVWRDRSWPLWRRVRHTAVVLSGLVLVWVLNDWNVLGFRYLGAFS